ncbi:hypothetical protein BV22DRAFT_46348 [Leucogyrophana mollusca]|uniref:Uncharacterized protein n=1 Tax=Leucogyrophana mollusca TaxID=85980 RepID=A0ACB8C1D8_9AGAM|nr:hypothetical protein BV22DRAFT_46348 [Leucogyrophana mollusca]
MCQHFSRFRCVAQSSILFLVLNESVCPVLRLPCRPTRVSIIAGWMLTVTSGLQELQQSATINIDNGSDRETSGREIQ